MRKNKNTVFQGLLTSDMAIGKIDQFIAGGNPDDPNILEYQEIIEENKTILERLSDLEEIILQSNTIKNFRPENIRLSKANGYVYARTTFFRSDNTLPDMRVVMGRTNNLGDMNVLANDLDFIANAYLKLKEAMEVVLRRNNKTFKTKYELICG